MRADWFNQIARSRITEHVLFDESGCGTRGWHWAEKPLLAAFLGE
jgi:hypothetical protein